MDAMRRFIILCLVVINSVQSTTEPIGSLCLKSLFVNDLLQAQSPESVNITVTCSTRIPFFVSEFTIVRFNSGGCWESGDLLSHESVECELTESVDDENLLNSHGFCEFTYARFLSPKSNAVACHLSGGSSFVIQMDCEGGCPKPEPTPLKPYCKQSKLLRPVDIGTSYSFNDGSPGFALYAPNSHCAWILPRNRYGSTNFLFSRLDLGEGDSIKAYAASDKKEKELIKEYKQGSVPESVSTTEEFLILEFWSDDKDEGLGFEGFYYFTEEQLATVAIAENLDEGTP